MRIVSKLVAVGALCIGGASAYAASPSNTGWEPEFRLNGAFPAFPTAADSAAQQEAAAPAPAPEPAVEPAPAPEIAAAPVGRETSCGKVVVAQSAGAVGDPCMTNEEFTASLNLSKAQLARLARYEREAVAH
jgi:hypothetical protein